MHIVMVTDSYLPQINGVVTAILLLSRELKRTGHKVTIIGPSYGARQPLESGVHRYWSVPFPTRMTKENRIAARVPLRPRFRWRRERIDVLHSHVEATMGSHALHWAKRLELPHVHTYHTFWRAYAHYAQFAAPLFRRFIDWRTRTYCGQCQRVIAPSQSILDEIRSAGGTVPIDIIPTGIDAWGAAHSPAETRRMLGIPQGRRLLVFVGRVAPEKNLGFLLDVLLRLNRDGADAHLLVVGDGPGKADLVSRVAALRMGDRVTFTGYIPRSRCFDCYAAGDVFVFPSLTETQGIVLLESMSVGTPVVALSAMGVAEFMKDGRGGLVAGPGDTEGFVAHVKRLLDDTTFRGLKATEAREKAADWSIEKSARDVVACYERAIAGFRRH